MVPFPVFWCFALLSNTAASAQWVNIAWALGDNRLPAAVLAVWQISALLGTIPGVLLGARAARRFGHVRTLVWSSAVEAVSCLAVAAAAWDTGGGLSTRRALLVAVVCSVTPFAVGFGGPSWLALVSAWPGTASRTRQLLLDSIQFQLGRTAGPPVAAFLIATVGHPVPVAAVANAATFLAVTVIMAAAARTLRHVPPPPAPAGGPTPARRPSWRLFGSTAVLAAAGYALASDTSRLYVARLIRAADQPAVVFSVTVSVVALTAAVAAAVAARRRLPDRRLAQLGLGLLAAGLVTWATASTLGVPAWIAGGALVGASLPLAHAALTSLVMGEAGDADQATGAAVTMATNTGAVALGSTVVAPLVSPLGPLVFLPMAAVAAVALARVRRRYRADPPPPPAGPVPVGAVSARGTPPDRPR
ncbi:MFS transporter [Micromonospora robiginosa]|uniref:MFS transporter n=1 Tax=Micromonospora robiginosa TaxID=2749844 RepID=A0A7L6B4V6_9ACTN|nr:MFS transporter [Micromonospora ferruginea]QLQ36949.1 hypothetical protein H1D33_27550 [Micromonospora ferruginea]